MRNLKVLPGLYFVLAVSLLIVPFRWCVAWITAAMVHELSHIAMLKLCGCNILSVSIGPNGAVIQSDCDNEFKKILCTLAGPFGGALLLLLLRIMPRVALCALIQSCYNLLPLSNLDGGRLLDSFVHILLPNHIAERVLKILETLIVVSIIVFALYGTFCLHLGLMPLVLAGLLLIKKSLANKGLTEYNRYDKNIRGYSYGNQQNFAHGSKACKIYRGRI